jgi:hypothetical protein
MNFTRLTPIGDKPEKNEIYEVGGLFKLALKVGRRHPTISRENRFGSKMKRNFIITLLHILGTIINFKS